jgi:hypothetical protein
VIKPSRALEVVFLAVLIGLSAEVYRSIRSTAGNLDYIGLTPGTVVSDFEAYNPQGRIVRISYSGSSKPTILYILSPMCAWCDKNVESANSLARQVKERYRMIGIAISNTPPTAHAGFGPYMFPIYTGIPKAIGRSYCVHCASAVV